jgi:hypothetical protein
MSNGSLTVVANGMVLAAGGYNSGALTESVLTEIFFAGVPPTLSGPTSANEVVGKQVTLRFAAAGNPAPTIAVSGSLPSGLGVVVQPSAIVVTGVPDEWTHQKPPRGRDRCIT